MTWIACSDRLPDMLPDGVTGRLYKSAKLWIYLPRLAEGHNVRTSWLWDHGHWQGNEDYWPEGYVTHWWDQPWRPAPPEAA